MEPLRNCFDLVTRKLFNVNLMNNDSIHNMLCLNYLLLTDCDYAFAVKMFCKY